MSVFGDIPVLFVNMDKHIGRREHIINILESGANEYHRIPGVNGAELVKKVKNDNIRFEMEGIEYDITHAETKKAHVIGCLLSHLNGFKFAMDNDYDIFVMMEDDIDIKYINKWDMSIPEIIKIAPDDWGIIKLHSNNRARNVSDYQLYRKGQKFRKLSTQMNSLVYEWSTACYVVNRKYLESFYSKYMNNGVFRIDRPKYIPADITMYAAENVYVYTCPIFNVTDVSGNREDRLSNEYIKKIYDDK